MAFSLFWFCYPCFAHLIHTQQFLMSRHWVGNASPGLGQTDFLCLGAAWGFTSDAKSPFYLWHLYSQGGPVGLLLAINLMLSGDLTFFILLWLTGTWKEHRSSVWDQLVLSALLYFKVHGDSSETSLLSVCGFGIFRLWLCLSLRKGLVKFKKFVAWIFSLYNSCF